MHNPTRVTRSRRNRKTGRRHPLATVALIALGLMVTGGAYTAISATSSASADTDLSSQSTIDQGAKLYSANCSTCHGVSAVGTANAPTLVGVGAASVDFQVGTGRMPLAADGPQAEEKPSQFTDEETQELAAYVASLATGPSIPTSAETDTSKGNAATGAELFRTNCAMCHNVAGAGGALTEGKYAPSLTEVSGKHIWEAMETGPQSMPVFNDLNISPTEKRDIITYLRYTATQSSVGGVKLGDLGPVAEGLFMWIFGLGAVVALTIWITAKSN